MNLPRTLEPEVMDDNSEADVYDNINHQAVNAAFAVDFLKLNITGTRCLDIGTGTALIPIEICQRSDDIRIMAVDASIPMLELARYRIELAGMHGKIQLSHCDGKNLPFENGFFDAVVSNSLVHHLPQPIVMLREAWRVLAPGGWLFIRDLCRPDSDVELEQLVERHSVGETEQSKQLLRQSLHAALTLEEGVAAVTELGIPSHGISLTSDRHWTIQARKPS